MRAFILGLALVAIAAGGARGAERLAIDGAAWQPVENSSAATAAPEKTPDGKPATALPCDMARVRQRSYWDSRAKLDLSPYGRIAFWVKLVGDPSAVSGAILYFNAGPGWYGAPFALEEGVWQRVVLDRGAFKTEDAPAGWNAIETVRIAFWKGRETRATVYVGGMEATANDVVVVRNARAGQEAESETDSMARMLAHAGIDAGTVDDADVERGVLRGKRLAIYPDNPRISDGEMDQLEAFVKAGGKLLVCYALAPRMAALLGIKDNGWQRAEPPGQFSRMQMRAKDIMGLPNDLRQGSWNIQRVAPAGNGARVVAEWLDGGRKDTGFPAITMNDAGAYVSHVFLGDDPPARDRVLRALLGHLDPAIWETAARAAVDGAGSIVPRWATFDEAEKAIRAMAAGKSSALFSLDEAHAQHGVAARHLAAKQYALALDDAVASRSTLTEAYALAQTARPQEMRAVWCHSAYGVEGMSWDRAIQLLADSGFNTIIPNMLWGGVADYPSKVLPVRDRVASAGDQIAACLAAAHRRGVQVHVWKVDWNLGGAPDAFVARMRAEARMQRSNEGKEVLWLCPSNPANFELERDSLLEVVRNYAVDGIHFDYIRYPDSTSCYCDGCRRRFEERTGSKVADWPADVLRGGPRYAAYQEFRRSNITRLVKAVSEGARAIRPGVKISAAVFASWPDCREDVGQDWGEWVRQGYLDFVCPMDYTDSDREYRARVRVQREAVAGRIPLCPGVGASSPGLSVGQIIDQIRIGREAGAQGFTIFNYDARLANEVLPALGKGLTKGSAKQPDFAKR